MRDSIFQFLDECKNEHPDGVRVDVPASGGYAGPISEVFATPFIVVAGTHIKDGEAPFMNTAMRNLTMQYRRQFFGANFIRKKDTEVTDEDIEKYSLVLVGNAESNAVWGRLAAKYGRKMTPREPVDEWLAYPTESAFAEVFRNPVNKERYLFLIGSDTLKNLALLKDFNPYTAWFDSYVLKHLGEREREYVTEHR